MNIGILSRSVPAIFCISFLMISCVNSISDESETAESGDVPIRLAATMEGGAFTRMTDTAFEEGDRAGLFATTPTGALDGKRYIDNAVTEYQSDGMLLSIQPLFYPENDVPIDFFCYYPYRREGIPKGEKVLTVSVPADQSSDEAWDSARFLTATAKQVTATDETLNLDFRYRLSKVVIRLKPTGSLTADALLNANPAVIGTSFLTKGDYNPADHSFANLSEPSDIVPHGEWKKSAAGDMLIGKEIVVMPQEIGALDRNIAIELGGKIYREDIEQKTLRGGDKCTITITLSPSDSNLIGGITVSISDWNDVGEAGSETTDSHDAIHTAIFSFRKSNVYRACHEGEVVAEVWQECLIDDTQAWQAVTAYPMTADGECDLKNGLLLKIDEASGMKCGGRLSWNDDGLGYTYTEGTELGAVDVFYVAADGSLTLESSDNTRPVTLNCYTYLDCRDRQLTEYPLTKIGTQIWMAKNLCAISYADGTALERQTLLGYTGCYYKVESKEVYFYNGETLMAGEMAPDGWQIATEEEWAQLKSYIRNNVSLLKAGTWSQRVDKDKEVAPVSDLTNFHAYPVGIWMDAGQLCIDEMVVYWSWNAAENKPATYLTALIGEENTFYETNPAYYERDSEYKGAAIRCIKKK